MTSGVVVALMSLLGFVLVAVGLLSWTGRLRRNSLVGIRTFALMSSPQAWERGHRAAGLWIVAAGVVSFGFAVLTWRMGPSSEPPEPRFTIGYTLAVLACLGIAVIMATRAAKRA